MSHGTWLSLESWLTAVTPMLWVLCPFIGMARSTSFRCTKDIAVGSHELFQTLRSHELLQTLRANGVDQSARPASSFGIPHSWFVYCHIGIQSNSCHESCTFTWTNTLCDKTRITNEDNTRSLVLIRVLAHRFWLTWMYMTHDRTCGTWLSID